MNGVNVLFVISCIFIPLLLISINYSSISDFYEYYVPLNSLEVSERHLDKNSNIIVKKNIFQGSNFNEIVERENSQCITTPMNYFCFTQPNFNGRDTGASEIVSSTNTINGEIHFDSINEGEFYFTMKGMSVIKGDTVIITFADNDYRVGNRDIINYEIIDEFEFSTVIEKFDTFIAKCNNYEGTSVTLVQYLGITTIDDIDYLMTWHTRADSESGGNCDYPQIIQHSMGYNFGL